MSALTQRIYSGSPGDQVQDTMALQFVSTSDTASQKTGYFEDPRLKEREHFPKNGLAISSAVEWELEKPTSLIVLPRFKSTPYPRFYPLQKWEGYVLSVAEDTFWARLIDLNTHGVEEEAEFLLEDVPAADRELIDVGAVFYWAIGYEDKVDGQRMRCSTIRFRRLPVWSRDELETAKRKAEELESLFASQQA